MQNIEFERLYANSGAKTRSQFILSAIFGRPAEGGEDRQGRHGLLHPADEPAERLPPRGSELNQVAKAVHSGELTEKKALALLYKLEQLTVEYISLNKEIIRLTKEFERWLQR